MTRVWEFSQAAGTDLLVLLALADNANDEGECWPSIRYVAQKCRIDTRTTQRRIRSLEELGEVVVIRGGGKASTAGGTKSNRYRIVVHIPDEEGGGNLPGSGTDARDGVAPVPGDGVAPVPPEPSSEPSVNRHSLAPASADAGERASLKTAIADACGIDLTCLTTSAAGKLGKATKEIAEAGGTANEVAARARAYRQKYPTADLTDTALATHWSALGKSQTSSARPARTRVEEFGQSAALIAETLEDAARYLESSLDSPDELAAAMAIVRDRRPDLSGSAPLEAVGF